MNRLFSILCSLGVFLLFLGLAACGDDGGDDGPKSSGSGRPNSSAYIPSSESKGDGSIDENSLVFDILPDGRYLDINVQVATKDADENLKRVEVKVNGTIINDPNVTYGRSYSFNTATSDKTLTLKNYCDAPGRKLVFELMARLEADTTKVTKNDEYYIPEEICFVPSSSSDEQSSSSSIVEVIDKELEEVTFSGGQKIVKLNTSQGNKGIKLSAEQLTESTSDADIYFKVTSEEFLVANSGINIIERFDRERAQYVSPSKGRVFLADVSDPKSTKGFTPASPNDSGESEIPYAKEQYYMVRTSGATEWNSNCFLVYAVTEPMLKDGNTTIEVKVWKVK